MTLNKNLTYTLILVTILSALSAAALAETKLDVVYPRFDAEGNPPRIGNVDSTFVFGSVHPPGCPVVVNGVGAVVYRNGAFLAWVPVDHDNKNFRIYACSETDEKEIIIPFEDYPAPEHLEIKADFPLTLQIINPNTVMRYSENYGVYYLFPAKNARCTSSSAWKNFYKVRLNSLESVWVEDKYVKPMPSYVIKPGNRIYSITVEESADGVTIAVPTGNYPLHKVIEETDPPELKVFLYGVESHIDAIRNQSRYIREIRWEQLDEETLVLRIFPDSPQLWGYRAEIGDDGSYLFQVRKPPGKSLKNLKIAIDPGHGGEEIGAIGPTRTLEKDINLILSLQLAKILRKHDYQVFLTREEDRTVPIYKRMEKADAWGADIFISVHNNALGDGVYPFDRRGSSVYHYQPKSLDLGRAIHRNLVERSGLADDGFFYGNLAVPRTTYMPSVLIETAYLMHPEDEMLLADEKVRKRIVLGIYKGIEEFIKHAGEKSR